jgi:acyl CoA:acetate/3-ketoacid CoA transferase beta subunit
VAATETAQDYTLNELMCVLAAREIRDRDVVFVGIGLPNLACNLARATHAPNMTLIYESGAIGAQPDRVPPSIGDPALVTGSLMVTSMADVFQCLLQNGKIQIGFLGGAQVDRYGNINTTVVGPYDAPKVRLPGSGGASEIAAHAQRVLIVTKLDKRAFPEKVDFNKVGEISPFRAGLTPHPPIVAPPRNYSRDDLSRPGAPSSDFHTATVKIASAGHGPSGPISRTTTQATRSESPASHPSRRAGPPDCSRSPAQRSPAAHARLSSSGTP